MPWSATSPGTTQAAGPDRIEGFLDRGRLVARSSSQLGAPAAQRGRTRLTAASSDAPWFGEEAQKGADLTASQPCLPVRRWTARRVGDTPI
jgi:hypothetical protein